MLFTQRHCKLSTSLFRLSFLIIHISNVDLLLVVTTGWYFRVVQVGHSYRQNGTILAEAQRSNTGVVTMKLTQSLLVESVPNVDVAVGTTRRKSIVTGMKTYRVHGINVLDVVVLYPMTLEGVLFLLGFGGSVQVFYRHSSFYATQNVALKVKYLVISQRSKLENTRIQSNLDFDYFILLLVTK